eukprot:TRINITY_DN7881_c0_g3_i2.p1 TRINITY_DN7881_c0_g3~~TRINITY_DN7881_c0_g3_i2.p1  ORF type:complete len:463 (-),score=51.41 TRINITY_DN7881_c0_g3_i2:77-1465(-)
MILLSLFLSLLCLTGSAPPQITTASYNIVRYVYGSFFNTALLLMTTFDQDVYTIPICEGGNVTEVVFKPCSKNDLSCLDENGLNLSSQPDNKTWNVTGSIANWQSCTGALMIHFDFVGNALITYTFGNNSQVSSKHNLLLCCKDLRNVTYQWDGSFFLTINVSRNTQIGITIPANPKRLELLDWHTNVQWSVDCDNDDDLPPCKPDLLYQDFFCPFSITPYNDSFFVELLSRSGYKADNSEFRLPKLQIQNRTLYMTFPLELSTQNQFVSYSSDYSKFFGYNGTEIITKYCTVRVHPIINAAGEYVNNSVAISKRSISCDFVVYNQILQDYKYLLGSPYLFYRYSEPEFQNFLKMVTSFFSRESIGACVGKALEFLIQNSTSLTVNTTYCTKEYFSESWSLDPCCNTSLQETQCCLSQSFTYNTSKWYPSNSQHNPEIEKNCLWPDCTRVCSCSDAELLQRT